MEIREVINIRFSLLQNGYLMEFSATERNV